MSYIKNRIARDMEDPEFRAAFEEEEALLARQNERRAAVMGQVAAMRKAQGVTQHDVAAALKISQSRVSQLERGSETLSVDHLLDLLELLKVRMVLVGDDGPAPVAATVGPRASARS